jgi:hypothetical protein
MPTANEQALTWRFSLTQPPPNWIQSDFDASSWPQGQAGFGTNGLPTTSVRTSWVTPDIWLRREVVIESNSSGELRLRLYRSSEVQIYLNGVLAKSLPAHQAQYEIVNIRAAARATIKAGKNVVAVHAKRSSTGQFFDLGLVEVVPTD